MSATAIAPTNIAVIKYWGKRDAKLNLPLNSSISVTLDQADLQTVTTAYALSANAADRLVLNDKETPVNARTATVLRELRALLPDSHAYKTCGVLLVSKNSFPTAAGLASSAAGYAAMVTAVAGLFGLDFDNMRTELSRIARQGSGSATRSLFGGFVAWNMGLDDAHGMDSEAVQVAPESHWSTLEALICVASDAKKHVASTAGMNTSVETSQLLDHRAKVLVAQKFDHMSKFIRSKNESAVFELTMRDSNQFHACCLDTYPPIFYMNDTSRAVIRLVTELNTDPAKPLYGYTFDAGPNAVIFCDRKNMKHLMDAMIKTFPPSIADVRQDPDFAFVRGRTYMTRAQVAELSNSDSAGALMYLFHTGIGRGARVLKGEEEAKFKLAASSSS